MKRIRITCDEHALTEGLFGMIILYIMEVLPFLDKIIHRPIFEIKSIRYGNAPDYLVIPGVLEQIYETHDEKDEIEDIDLRYLRSQKGALYVLGDNFEYAHEMFFRYFRIPQDILDDVENYVNFDTTLGVHYRGTDKNDDKVQTNAVSAEYMCSIIADVLKRNRHIKHIYLATDQNDFYDYLVSYIKDVINITDVSIINNGKTTFWQTIDVFNNNKKARDAMKDCIMLSRCKMVIKCQSALSAFAKVLNPDLEIYRISASKKFADIPYWPDAYIPKYTSDDAEVQKQIDKQMIGDWTYNEVDRVKFSNFDSMQRM